MLKSDKWILEQCRKTRMIAPYVDRKVSSGVVSYGISSYGYDIRLGNRFAYFEQVSEDYPVDVKRFEETTSGKEIVVTGDHMIIPPHGFLLGHSYERISMPEDVLALCIGKSTYARVGIVLNTTPLEPGWSGYLTLELSNTTDSYVKLYVGEGIGQLVFFGGDELCNNLYPIDGTYQRQSARPVFSRVR